MKTPVIIPAFNEELRLGRTLEALPADLVEPIVAVNGSTDATATIAEDFGAYVVDIEQQGKMPAIQKALEHLGRRALQPLLILDADARPIFPQRWHRHMVSPISSAETPVVVGGPVWYTGSPRVEAILRSVYRAGRTITNADVGNIDRAIQFGPNMGVHIKERHVLDLIMGIPNYWPGEDRALAEAVSHGDGTYRALVHPYATVWNPTSISAISLKDRLALGSEDTLKVVAQRYVERGPQDAKPYESQAL